MRLDSSGSRARSKNKTGFEPEMFFLEMLHFRPRTEHVSVIFETSPPLTETSPSPFATKWC